MQQICSTVTHKNKVILFTSCWILLLDVFYLLILSIPLFRQGVLYRQTTLDSTFMVNINWMPLAFTWNPQIMTLIHAGVWHVHQIFRHKDKGLLFIITFIYIRIIHCIYTRRVRFCVQGDLIMNAKVSPSTVQWLEN